VYLNTNQAWINSKIGNFRESPGGIADIEQDATISNVLDESVS